MIFSYHELGPYHNRLLNEGGGAAEAQAGETQAGAVAVRTFSGAGRRAIGGGHVCWGAVRAEP